MTHMTVIGKKCLLGLFLVCLLFTFTSGRKGCRKKNYVANKPPGISSIHIVDYNGFVEAITNRDRLNKFQCIDFLAPQPYQKVLRIYERDYCGNIYSVVTSYYENGNIKQMLEVMNGRASGQYYEWHPNGSLSVTAKIVGGTADITQAAEKTWLFDGSSSAWDEQGRLIAEIPYSQGFLNGYSTYYHANGQVWKKIPFCNGELQGELELYKKSGDLLMQTTFVGGQKQGSSYRYWSPELLASKEEYCAGRLETGSYYNPCGELISEVRNGTGFRSIFGKEGISELQQYIQGMQEGQVKAFNPKGRLIRSYTMKGQLKSGEEIEYYDFPYQETLQPKLSIQWYEGCVHGITKTWYSNGTLESQREMAKNQKSGLASAWYQSGNLMLMEEYDKDKLVRGDYFRDGDRIPVSQISDGSGIATIYDAEGHFIQKVNYHNGKPDL